MCCQKQNITIEVQNKRRNHVKTITSLKILEAHISHVHVSFITLNGKNNILY